MPGGGPGGRPGGGQTPDTIDGVVEALTDIVDDCIDRSSRLGYFAALYRKVTMAVRDDIDRGGVFDDDGRMERLDVAFAGRYLDAYHAHRRGDPCSRSWQAAFDAASSRRLIIVQNLLLGINAHINLDLGAAAVEVSPGNQLAGLRGDFDRINDVLAFLSGSALADIDELSPWLALLNRVGGRSERAIISFSIDVARREAWRFAETLAPAAATEELMARRDGETAELANLILHPGPLISAVNWVIKAREAKNVPEIIAVLAD